MKSKEKGIEPRMPIALRTVLWVSTFAIAITPSSLRSQSRKIILLLYCQHTHVVTYSSN